jgi:hypothetical protein
VFYSNSAIEGLTLSNNLSAPVKNQLLGEAKFLRALSYFYLANLYGDLPLVLSTDYKESVATVRQPKADIYKQIVSDLKDAYGLLSENYLDASLLKTTAERVRPTKYAAAALLSRVYLYLGDWINAEAEASIVINNASTFGLLPLNSVFLKNSKEAIWQLQPTYNGWNTEDAKIFVLNAAFSNTKPVYLNQNLLTAFENNDARRLSWIKDTIMSLQTYSYPFKYKLASFNDPVNEYLMVLRLGEQYLIRAEARAQQNNVSGAQSDLNAIRNRAGLSNTTANDKPSLLIAILHERQIELFSEWGHRWLDLQRTSNVDAVMSIVTPLKGGASWSSYQKLYPVPVVDIQRDPNLTQNPGYN